MGEPLKKSLKFKKERKSRKLKESFYRIVYSRLSIESWELKHSSAVGTYIQNIQTTSTEPTWTNTGSSQRDPAAIANAALALLYQLLMQIPQKARLFTDSIVTFGLLLQLPLDRLILNERPFAQQILCHSSLLSEHSLDSLSAGVLNQVISADTYLSLQSVNFRLEL
jgi:hypothetical protein